MGNATSSVAVSARLLSLSMKRYDVVILCESMRALSIHVVLCA